MKKHIQLFAVACFLFTGSAIAQETAAETPKKVEVKEKNGVLTVTITSEENGFAMEEIYTGEAAKKKLAELEGESMEEGVQVELEVTEENGVKTVTVITRENGKETTETFVGAEAEAKLAELEGNESKEEKKEFKMNTEKPKVIEKSVD